jgi:hypothetical protein
MRKFAIFAAVAFVFFSDAAAAQEDTFLPRDAADGIFGRANDMSGTPEERGERIHNSTIDHQIQTIENSQGSGAALRFEQNYACTHSH